MIAELQRERIVGHPFVTGEIALGSLATRAQTIARMQELRQFRVASPHNVQAFIEAQQLWNRGLGYTDVHLLVSVRLSPGASLWSRDKPLRAAAERLDIAAPLD